MLREMKSSAYAHSFKRFARCAVVGLALAGLAACGGGGGGGMTMPESATGPQDAALQAGEELATAMANGNLPLPSGHGIPSGRIEIAARAYQDRNGLRFSCTGAELCVVAVDADGGQARVESGNVRLARLPAAAAPSAMPPVAMPEPEPAAADGPWPPYLIMDVAGLASVLGGSALEWGDERAVNEIRMLYSRSLAGGAGRIGGLMPDDPAEDCCTHAFNHPGGNTSINWPTRAKASITDEHGISHVQVVTKYWSYPRIPSFYRYLGGILDHGEFWVVEDRTGSDDPSHDNPFSRDHDRFFAFIRIYDTPLDSRNQYLRQPIRATWRGSMIGIGHTDAYPNLYREPIAGDVEISTDVIPNAPSSPAFGDGASVDVRLSNIKKVNTGEAVTLSTQHWRIVESNPVTSDWPSFDSLNLRDEVTPPYGEESVEVFFGGPGYDNAGGVFRTREALGAFGAKKQEE